MNLTITLAPCLLKILPAQQTGGLAEHVVTTELKTQPGICKTGVFKVLFKVWSEEAEIYMKVSCRSVMNAWLRLCRERRQEAYHRTVFIKLRKKELE